MEKKGYLSEEELMQREDRCRKALKTVMKAMLMRLFVAAVLIWSVIRSGMPRWAVGLMALVLIINLTGLLPLWQEWRKQRRELKAVIAKFE